MFDEGEIQEMAEKARDADSRFPLQLREGYHTTTVAAGTPEMGDEGLGFYEPVFDGDYNSLQPGQWVTVNHPTRSGTERYQMRLEPVGEREAESILSEEEFQLFRSGSALVPGNHDHRDMSYRPRKIDDRIYRETVHRSSLIEPGEQINLWSNVEPGELPWEELGELGHPLAEEMKTDDHRVQYT